jgi:Flp pilus assembly protein TadD
MRALPSPADDARRVLARDDQRLLAEIGFMAATAGHDKSALAIFTGLRTLSPDRSHPYLGLAMAHMGVGRNEQAVRLLRDEAMPAVEEEVHEVELFLGLALHVARREDESRRVLQRVAELAPDGARAKLAAGALLQRRPAGEPPRGPAMGSMRALPVPGRP